MTPRFASGSDVPCMISLKHSSKKGRNSPLVVSSMAFSGPFAAQDNRMIKNKSSPLGSLVK